MKPVYMTSDGKTFDSKEKAENHEKMAQYYPTILEWAAEEYEGKQGMATRAANIIIAWELSREAVIAQAKANTEATAEESA